MELSEFGQYIEKLRIERGIDSRSELARMAKTSATTISRVIAGKQKPTPETLGALAPHLGVSYEHLMQKAGYLLVAEEASTYNFKNNNTTLYDKIDKLSARDRAVVEALIQALSSKGDE